MATLALSSVANAATIVGTPSTMLPKDHYTAPDPTAIHGTFTSATGSQGGQYASPFADNTSEYGAVQSGYVEYDFTSFYNALSLIWGSPDDYNTLTFLNNGKVVDSIIGTAIGDRGSNYFVTLKSDAAFNQIQLSSGQPAFEYSNVSAVPLPASLPMFGLALLGLGAVGYSVKRKSNTAA